MVKTVRGTRDLLPEEVPLWRFLERTAERIFEQYGYHEIRMPTFEKTELFVRAVGEATDIVEKEMYSFVDRNGDALTLRPEGTASVVRSFMEHGLERSIPWRVFYSGAMYRHERPQKGRQRQFHQIGCECFGLEGPSVDAEIMAMTQRFFREIHIDHLVTLKINTLGCSVCRSRFREPLLAHLDCFGSKLCEACQRRRDRNPLRVLDCKSEGCRSVAETAPRMLDHLCTECLHHFEGVQRHLKDLKSLYRVEPNMVRGLDYYTRTVFEVTTDALGAQDAVAAGGRYDNLVSEMGGRPMPAIGFAMGMERLALLLHHDQDRPELSSPAIYVVALGATALRQGLSMVETLRSSGWSVELNQRGGSIKSQMKKAGRSGALWTLIIGERESDADTTLIKEMATGEQQVCSQKEIIQQMQQMQRMRQTGETT